MKEKIAKNPKLKNQCTVVEYESEATDIPDDIKSMVEGYPTIFYKKNGGQLEKYDGGRSSSELVAFAHKLVGGGDVNGGNDSIEPMMGGKRLRKSGKRKTVKRRKTKKSQKSNCFSLW